MNLFEFKIYDTHEVQSFDGDNTLTVKVFSYWHKFNMTLSIEDLWITSYREYTLFDTDYNPTECTKVYLSDGSYVYAVNKYETFDKNYLAFLDSVKANSSDTP